MKKIILAGAMVALSSGVAFADSFTFANAGYTPTTEFFTIILNGVECKLKTSKLVTTGSGCNYILNFASGQPVAQPMQMNGCSMGCNK